VLATSTRKIRDLHRALIRSDARAARSPITATRLLFGKYWGKGADPHPPTRFFEEASVSRTAMCGLGWRAFCKFVCGALGLASAVQTRIQAGRRDHRFLIVAIVTYHLEFGYNWKRGGGIEYPLFWAIVGVQFLGRGRRSLVARPLDRRGEIVGTPLPLVGTPPAQPIWGRETMASRKRQEKMSAFNGIRASGRGRIPDSRFCSLDRGIQQLKSVLGRATGYLTS